MNIPCKELQIGIHLLDFALFDQPERADQALWCFELRDRTRAEVR